jgi:hypothetical protein
MKLPRLLRRLIGGDRSEDSAENSAEDSAGDRGGAAVRNAVVWIFITLVALFLTEQHSLFDGPVPLPPELGLEPGHPR